MKVKDLFKIRHRLTGLYSKGGSSVSLNGMGYGWCKDGKVWQGIGPLKVHLSQYLPKFNPHCDSGKFGRNIGVILAEWEIIRIKMVVDATIPMSDLYDDLELIKRASK